MDKQALVEWIKTQLYAGRRLQEQEEEEAARLYGTLDRLCTYLSAECGLERIEDTTLEALRGFAFSYPDNDDHRLRIVFSHLGRSELTEHLSMVSADKYFQNRKLPVLLKAMDDLEAYVKNLRQVGVRMAPELLERGATPDGRAELAAAAGIPPEALLKMVQCCDLARMTGMSGKTLKRAFAMGYDTLERFRASTPERIEDEIAAHLHARGERTNRMVPFSSFVHQSRRLEDVIVW